MDESEEAAFLEEEVKQHVNQAIESTLSTAVYTHSNVPQWTSDVVEGAMKKLTQLQKPFKYIVTCIIMQKNGAGMHTASSCFWDNQTDGSCTTRWDGKTMYCVVTVFGLGI